ncbi:MAG TPA: CRISPR-associated endonuclease Cas3'' [Candidatus Didemnitutus sp.]|jgi:CRISPR-associated endonuclease/helicase Cas3
MPVTFNSFFGNATATEANPDGNTPYDYQRRLACGERGARPEADWLTGGTTCQSQLISIPTGLGKTAAVVLAWLWNRIAHPDAAHREKWPRRLVYCLPMRALVEQTRDEIIKWLSALSAAHSDDADLRWLVEHSPIILMGGEENDPARRDWDIHPERPAILIGTQDMLLSRALNRGYGMARARWPMHFGLLNNDCLWVMDETQLMGVGVETSAQLDGFRHKGNMPTVGACPTWWMSATLDNARFATVDHPEPADGWPMEALSDSEKSNGRPKELITAPKKLLRATLEEPSASFTLNPATKSDYARQLAVFINRRHKPDTLTLVVLNRVPRAREVYEALVGGKKPLRTPESVALIHSRFRPMDRERHTKLLFGEGGRIVIATQAVEAGVDVSARLLITELAPWSSLVQRMGRCNRRADISDAEVLWVDIEPDEKGELLLPYSKDELDKARNAIAPLTNASPKALSEVNVPEGHIIRPVIRRRDLVDLFDTTPDLCGQDLDVSRYIRDGDDSDVQFYWRAVEGEVPGVEEREPQRHELCRVSIGEAAKFLGKRDKPRVWRWNPLDEKWESPGHPRPGVIYLVDVASGGYNDDQGWTGDPKHKPTPRPPTGNADKESYCKDPDTFSRSWQELDRHTKLVVEATDAIAGALAFDDKSKAVLHTAALWHDVGKAHDEFQAMLRNGDTLREGTLWAKSADKDGRCNRRGFRHELASALAWLLAGPQGVPERDLIAYLIATHHGKVRLSIRSLPNEPTPPGEDRLFARGVWHGDKLPSVPLGEVNVPEVELDLTFMRMGEGPRGPSWLARTVGLRDRFGPFRLAYFESLLRAADARASRAQTT